MSWNVVLFIYLLVAVVVTAHTLLTREKEDATGAITSADIARLTEWAADGHMAPADTPVAAAPDVDADLLPGEEEDHWEDLANGWEFPEISKNSHDDWKKLPIIMVGSCKYNRALRGCGRRGKGKQKGGKHVDKKAFRRADTKAHLKAFRDC